MAFYAISTITQFYEFYIKYNTNYDVNCIKNMTLYIYQDMTDIYDVGKYSDYQLIDILDLFNPTDRELEAKIMLNINNFSNMKNEYGDLMSGFFSDMHQHFFDVHDEDNEDIVEGFESSDLNMAREVKVNDIQPIDQNPSKDNEVKKNDVVYTHAYDYVKGALNPILKETISRTISVDSQFRDIKLFPNSTDFTFNLTDVLNDVVSIKLYSIHIPYTWYNINNDYGSNFFFISGNVPGIDTEDYVSRIQIPPGNYEIVDIVDAVKTSLLSSFATYFPEIDVGKTSFTVNPLTTKCKIDIDLTSVYNESSYHLVFPTFSSANILEDRFKTIPAFLGFNYDTYFPSQIFSKVQSFINTGSDNSMTFNLSPSNRIFYILSYVETTDFKLSDLVKMFNADKYTINDNIINYIPIEIDLKSLSNKYYLSNIITNINYQLTNNKSIKSSSSFSMVNRSIISQFDTPQMSMMMDITLNRKTTKTVKNMKTVVFFPEVEDTLWLGSNSAFKFEFSVNELCDIISETANFSENYRINSNPYIYLECINPHYNGGINDISINLANSGVNGYNIFQLHTALQESMSAITITQLQINPKFNCICTINDFASSTNIVGGISQIAVDIQRKFDTSSYEMIITDTVFGASDLNGIPINGRYLNLNLSSHDPITNIFTFSGDSINQTTYSINGLNDTIIINSIGIHNASAPPIRVVIPHGEFIFTDFDAFIKVINDMFKSPLYNPTPEGVYLQNTSMSYLPFDGFIRCVLALDIRMELTENDYVLNFYDPSANDARNILFPDKALDNAWSRTNQNAKSDTNAWYNIFHYADQRYELAINSVNNPMALDGSISMNISGVSPVLITSMYISSLNNYFYIKALIDPYGGVYTKAVNPKYSDIQYNDVRVSIAEDSLNRFYTSSQINMLIQDAFNQNPILKGSTIIVVNGVTIIRLNINKIFTGNDYKLTFYDTNTFTRCNFGSRTSIQNVSIDSTLGWMLGFRNIQVYSLSSQYMNTDTYGNTFYYTFTNTPFFNDPNTSNIISMTADTSITPSIYNYFTLCLDDYTQNHINDGLISITQRDTSIPLPSYANRTMYRCNRNTNGNFIGDLNDPNRTISRNNLTSKQVYSANQILDLKKTGTGSTYSTIKADDLFGIIPINTSKVARGQSFVEFGGSLQNQSRVYFGPVNISRMTVRLMNDKGNRVDLNNANWSFTLIAELLYNNTNSINSRNMLK